MSLIKFFFFSSATLFLFADEAQANAAQSREKFENSARPLIEDALTKPVSELYEAAGRGNGRADLTLGLALLADRRLPDTPQSLDDIKALATLEERVQAAEDGWLALHKDKTAEEIDWGNEMPLTQSENDMLDRIQMIYSPNYWLSRSLNPTPRSDPELLSSHATGYTCGSCAPGVWISPGVFPTNFGAKEYVSGAAKPLDGKRSDVGVIMTAIHCIEAVREKAALPADVFLFYRLKLGQLPAVSRYNAIAQVVYELQNPSLKLSYATGVSACDGQMQHYLDMRRAEPLEPSALRTRFGITN
jgi:hypothetical protein